MFFLISASEELSQSRSQETNGQAKYEDGSGTALVFSLIQAKLKILSLTFVLLHWFLMVY